MNITIHAVPAAPSNHITLIESIDGRRLGKAYMPEKLEARHVAESKATSIPLNNQDDLEAFLTSVGHRTDVAVVLGDSGIREPYRLLSKELTEVRFGHHEDFRQLREQYPVDRIQVQAGGLRYINRTKSVFAYSQWAYLDIDGIPLSVDDEVVVRAIKNTYAELQPVRQSYRRSTSSNIVDRATNSPRKAEYGLRIYFQTTTPQQLKAYFSARKIKFESLRCGTLDISVFGQSNRLDYIGAPELCDSLRQEPRPFSRSEGTQDFFTVLPEWLPVAESEPMAVKKPLDQVLRLAKDQEAVITATVVAIEQLLERAGQATAGDRHETVVKLGRLLGGFKASGCLVKGDDEIVAWVTESLLGATNWWDKTAGEIERAVRSGLEKGATEPVWPSQVAKQYKQPLIAAGVEARVFGARLIAEGQSQYQPAESEDTSIFTEGYMTLSAKTLEKIQKLLAAGTQVTLLLKGPQGCGKTEVAKALREVLKDFTLITPRQSLAATGAKRLNLVNYQDVKLPQRLMDVPFISICVDSTRRLPFEQAKFIHQTTVMFDEAEQIIERLVLNNTLGAAFQADEWMIQSAGLLILADADLKQSTVDSVRKLRPDAVEISLIHTGQMMKGIPVKKHKSAAEVTMQARADLQAGRNVFLCADSRAEAETVYRVLKEFAPGRSLLVTSETYASDEVQALMRNPQLARKYSLIVASPSISTGVDFTFRDEQGQPEKLFNVYGIFKGGSVTAETAKQALRRIRHPKEIGLYVNPAVIDMPPVDYMEVRERFRKGQITPVCNADLVDTPYEKDWAPVQFVDPKTGHTVEYPAPQAQTLHSAFYDAMAAKIMDIRDISRSWLDGNVMDLLRRDGAVVEEVEADEEKAEEGREVKKVAKEVLRQFWIEDRVNCTYHNPMTGAVEPVRVPTLAEYHQAKQDRKGSGRMAVGVDIFELQQVLGEEGVTQEAVAEVKDVRKEWMAQNYFELLHESAEFRRAYDMDGVGLVDTGNRKEISKIVRLTQFLAAQVGLDLGLGRRPEAAVGSLGDREHVFPIYKEKKNVFPPLAAPADWRWVPDNASVGRLLAVARSTPEYSDLLGLNAKNREQMVKQFNGLLKRFGLALNRSAGRGGQVYTLSNYDHRVALAAQRRYYALTLSIKECEIVQWLNVAARRRVLEDKFKFLDEVANTDSRKLWNSRCEIEFWTLVDAENNDEAAVKQMDEEYLASLDTSEAAVELRSAKDYYEFSVDCAQRLLELHRCERHSYYGDNHDRRLMGLCTGATHWYQATDAHGYAISPSTLRWEAEFFYQRTGLLSDVLFDATVVGDHFPVVPHSQAVQFIADWVLEAQQPKADDSLVQLWRATEGRCPFHRLVSFYNSPESHAAPVTH